MFFSWHFIVIKSCYLLFHKHQNEIFKTQQTSIHKEEPEGDLSVRLKVREDVVMSKHHPPGCVFCRGSEMKEGGKITEKSCLSTCG